MLTHYITAYTVRIRDRQRAACGTFIKDIEHSCEPTCPICLDYLTQTEAEDRETAAALERECPGFDGRMLGEDRALGESAHAFDETDLALGKED